jgi:predicted nucleic acid-binding protein
MHSDRDADNSGSDPQPAGHQISFPWDVEPPDKWKIQFHYTRISNIYTEKMNQYSLASNETSEGGGFQYEDCPEVFSGRNGHGALRLAWDTNILIDYAKYGQLIWADDEPDFPIEGEHYQEELVALREIMNLWMLRDIRIRMPFRQIYDAKLRLESKPEELWEKEIEQFHKTQEIRLWQLEQFHSALSCISLDAEIDSNVNPFDTLRDGSSNDEWDKSLLEEAIATGCHIFLTGDRKLKRRLDRMARDSYVAILSPTGLLDSLAQADELSIAKIGQYLMPDSHKFVHILEAHESGYPYQ